MDRENTQNNEMWDWQGTESFLEDNLAVMSECLWSSMNNNEDISFPIEDEFTPVKACGNLADYLNICEDTSKELEKCVEHSSQVKRRRLHFNPEISDTLLCSEEISSRHPRLKGREDSAVEDSSKMLQMICVNSDCTSSLGNETSDQSSDAWLASYFNDAEMQHSPSDMASDVQIDITEFCKTQSPPKCASMSQDRPVQTCVNIFKGRKSYIQTPAKSASSIVYPFAFIKPCGVHGGDMTLKDINQRIRAPPHKLRQNSDDSSSYPTSAFSGKPVVGRTTLTTDGGKGSITIMRTKG